MINKSIKLILTKDQASMVQTALDSYITGLREESKKHTGVVSELVEVALEQGNMLLAILDAKLKPCPACSGTGSTHQNCILR